MTAVPPPSHAPAPEPASPPVVIAVGWATVDLDRAATELAPLLDTGTAFEGAADSVLLGARCRVGRASRMERPDGATVVILLEPRTEGRLAATLARHGEGWCATWEVPGPVVGDGLGAHGDPARDPGDRVTSTRRAGPLGDERLVSDGPASGPHRLLVSAATIRA